ncbi:MAG: amino acid kinase [Candidatus Hydrothermarchaeales archaeon]
MRKPLQVVKVGGSLLNNARRIMALLKGYDVVVVPGGGIFADVVREVYESHTLSERAAHEMAVMAMNQYGMVLSDISGIKTVETIEDIRIPSIFLPYNFISKENVFEPSWDVTSDTIACHLAAEIDAERFIILTDVSGIILNGKVVDRISAKDLLKYGETCVDKELPNCLMKKERDCLVVDGRSLEEVKKAVEGEDVGTLIIGGE